MSCDFRVPEENPALARLLTIMRHMSLPKFGGGFCYFSESFLSGPRCALRMASREFMGSGYPADACGAICLSFRALAKLSLKI
jgi:hypothetical protein